VIATGVKAGDKVVTSGFAQLTDGAAITVSSPGGVPQAENSGEKKKRGEGKRKRSEKQ
jgi:hypothetical protein